MITEKNYKELADDVYKVDSGKEKNPVKEGSLVGGDKYQVLKVEDNTANGMQAMAVAPVDKNGNVDTSQVVIAYAGTNSADGKDLDTDLQSVGGGSKKLVSGSDMSVDGLTIADSQFETAMSFAKKIEKEYPKAKITTTGHSLGESLAMYVALHQGYKNVGFNGPDIHNLLSDKEIKYMQKHREQFRNYRNPHDGIGNITGNETETAIYVDRQNGAISEDHSLSEWRFDKNGNLVDKNGIIADEAHLYDAVETTVSDYMDQGFQGMKSKLKEGGYSSNETIFLDYLSASAVAQGLGIAAQIGHESIKSKADAAVAEAEETWKEIKKRPMMVEKLTDEEIMAVYAEEGVTYDTIVDSVKTHFNEKVTASQTLMATFTALGSQIETGIQELIAQDETLAGDITGWINGN